MWVRGVVKAVRRAALLLPLALTAAVLLLLSSRPALPPQDRQQPQFAALAVNKNNVTASQSSTTPEAEDNSVKPWFFEGGDRWPKPLENGNYKLFPEDDPYDDRIVEQLLYTFPKQDEAPIKRILLANGFSAWGMKPGNKVFIDNKCPVSQCNLVGEHKDAANAHAILYKDYYIPLNMPRPRNQIWILYYLECPYHTASLRRGATDMFNWTATYRRDSDIVTPYEKWVYYSNEIEHQFHRNYAANKTKKVAWFVSNCHARNNRLQYARQLSKYIEVDIYGACGPNQCPRNDPNCMKMLDEDYKFYLAFENSNCRDYITEKFFVNGLKHDILPIVMGAAPSSYAAIAPQNSYIHVQEFQNPKELAEYLHRLDRDDNLYNSYFKWKDTGEFINTFFWCRLCAMVHAAERTHKVKQYEDVEAWWRDRACSRGDWTDDSNVALETPEGDG